jgi:hypothetical protein
MVTMGRSAALTVVIVFLGVACHSTSGGELPPAAVVLDVSPRAARAGDVVVIRGAGLGTPGEVRVGASAVTAEILEWTDRQVALRMPHVGTWGRLCSTQQVLVWRRPQCGRWLR